MKRSSLTIVLVAVLVAAGAVIVVAADRDDSGGPSAEVPVVAATPAPDQITTFSRSTGIPARALTAYVAAAETVESDDPTCRIAWNTLAGIGLSESSHGAFGGATLDEEGVPTPGIIGVPLDGTGGNRAIKDTDDGQLDGDTTWDRAVGPLQFIPATWAEWGADGDGDGIENPQDLDDAALAAARYLCDAGGDLSDSEGWSRAILEYNESGEYARKVSRTASEYARAT